MPRRIEAHSVPGPAGRLEALLEEPEDREPRLAAVVCHPHPLYGGTMHNKVVFRIARGLRRAGMVVLRFNFRGVGASEGEHANLTGEVIGLKAGSQPSGICARGAGWACGSALNSAFQSGT